MTFVTRKACGSRIERSTCVSAAKLSTASASATSSPDRARVGDVPADEAQPGRLLGVVEHRPEVRLVAGVGELVEDRDPRPVVARQDVSDVRRADEARPAGDQQVRHTIGRSRGATSLPWASSSAASSAARSRLATVPASVQWPS